MIPERLSEGVVRRRSGRRLIAAAFVLGTLAAACGDDDESSDATTAVADAASTDAPSTDAPSTDAPSTDAPSTDAPSTDAPSTDAPSTDAPSTDAPSTDAPSTDAPSTDAPTTDAAADPVAEAQAAVDALVDVSNIEMPIPTDPVTPGEHKIAVLPAGLAGQGAKTVAPFVVEAIEAAGWESSDLLDGKFDPVTQSGLIQQAVQDGYDGIILVAITASSVSNAVEVASAAGVPIVCVNCGPDPDRSAAPDVVNSEGDAEAIGLAQGQYALAALGGPGSIVIFRDETYGQQIVQAQVTQDYLAENCPDCEVEVVDMTVTDATAPGVPLFSGFLSSHPEGSVDVVITPYDTASAPFAQAAGEAGRDELQFVGFGSLQVFYEMIAAGVPVGAKATVSVPIPFESWAGVDQMARLLADQEPWDSTKLPIALVTADNADQFNPETPYLDSGEDFRTAFLELWGLA